LIELGGRSDSVAAVDIGCGPGECVACELDGFGAQRVDAIDLDPRMVCRLASARRVRLARAGRSGTSARSTSTTAASRWYSTAVLHHVPDWRSWPARSRQARVLAPGGQFFSQDHDVANHDWFSRTFFSLILPTEFTNAQFLEELTAVGLTTVAKDDTPGELLVVVAVEGFFPKTPGGGQQQNRDVASASD
jgi:trans-aconitate methyltransferase